MKSVTSLAAVLLALLAACSKSTATSSDALHAGDLLVEIALDPDPPRAGDNVLHVTVNDAQGKPVDRARVGLVYDMPAMGAMPEMKGNGESKPVGGGKYDVSYSLAMLGDWTITLGIGAPGHPPAELRFKVSPPRKGYTVESRGAGGARREGGPQLLEVTPERQQLIGVVYAKVERRPLSLSLRAHGRVEVDETQVADVVLKYDAYVEKLFVSQTSQPDYVVAIQSQGVPGREQLVRAAEERLRLWGLSNEQIADLRKRGKAEPR